MTVSQHAGAPAGPLGKTVAMTTEEVLAEARRRVTPARDIASQRGDAELVEDLDEFLDDITVKQLRLDGVDRMVPHILAAMMGVTLGDR